MTTEEIIEWVDAAITLREDSFIRETRGLSYYSMSKSQALEAIEPKETKDWDKSIAMYLIDYSNDITDWMKQIEFEKLKNQSQRV